MAAVEIPLPQTEGAPFLVRAALSGVEYVIEFVPNRRLNTWTLNFYDAGRSPIYMGFSGVADWSLLSRCSDPRKPPGRLYLIDTTNRAENPTLTSLGTRHLLVYDDLETA